MKNILSKKGAMISFLLFLLAVGSFVWVTKDQLQSRLFPPKEPIHFHAGFLVVQNNQIIDFSNSKYMYVKPCVEEGEDHAVTPQQEQLEKAHLHGGVGDVVHIEAENALWKDLFTNINYEIDYNNTEVYSNRKKIDNFESNLIQPYESIVIFVGATKNKEQFLKKAVTQDHIKEAEQETEDC